ncbi:MAG: PEP-CTERM sorting domain-containing protein, partial [Vicinamibacterales bacterium]
NSINSSGWTIGAAADMNDYYGFTITPAPGFVMDLTDLDFSERASSTGPTQFDVRSSLDSFASPIFSGATTIDANSRRQFDLTAAFQDLTVPVTFRIFAFQSSASAGTWRLGVSGEPTAAVPANLQLVGDLTAVPEPTTLLLLGSGLAALATWRRRRK